MKIPLRLAIRAVVAVTLFTILGATATSATILRTDRVWNASAHNAFTDLVWHNGRFVLAFREGSQHGVPPVSQPGGYLRILTSSDGLSWTSAGPQIQGTSNEDLRDAKLSITPAGQLMLTGAAAFKNATGDRQSMAWFSTMARIGRAGQTSANTIAGFGGPRGTMVTSMVLATAQRRNRPISGRHGSTAARTA